MSDHTQLIDTTIIEAIVDGSFSDPFSVLGIHSIDKQSDKVIRAFLPGAEAIEVVGSDSETRLCELTRIHKGGFFEGCVEYSDLDRYRFRVHYPLTTVEMDDPYRFGSSISSNDLYLFHEGSHEHAYRFLGANQLSQEGVTGVRFTVWAPNARRVAVVGDFNNWDERTHPMRLHYDSGIWELFLPQAKAGDHYKYAIHGADGNLLPLKADPYARHMELRPGTATKVPQDEKFSWQDLDWLKNRSEKHQVNSAISIYEVHPWLLAAW